MPNNRFGWLKDLPDHRDIPYLAIRPMSMAPIELPDKVDLKLNCPPIYQQANLGSCTAQAIIAAYEMELIKQEDLPNASFSTLFLYYNERVMEGTVELDAGAYIRDGVKSINKTGICLEETWPYIISKFREKPPPNCYEEALYHQSILYASVSPNIYEIMLAMADGYPVIFGFTVYESFESDEVTRTGIMPFPKSGERAIGGHAVLAVGYNREKQHLIVRNSWGKTWGDAGYFYMPFSYINKLARDWWIIKQVE